MKIFVLSLFVCIFASRSEACSRQGLSPVAAGTGTIVPLYIYPALENGVHNWQPLIDAHAKYPIDVWAIVNVYNGPSNPIDPQYADAIQRLKNAGINTLGYVSTNYSRVSEAKVKADIDTWKSFYNPTGIFFDEMTNDGDSNHVEYYRRLGNYAKSQGFTKTVGNPGTDVSPLYVGVLDTIMIVEDKEGFPSQERICGWHQNHPRTQWGIFPYAIPSLDETRILDAKKCVGYIYVTHDGGDNPWDELPPYLNQLFELLSRSL